jgi:chemotaxis-related protein WspD
MARDGAAVAFPVDEIGGVHRFRDDEIVEAPRTVASAPISFTTGLIPWKERHAGKLDDELLLYAITRNLS